MDKNANKIDVVNIKGIAFSKQELLVISALMRSPSYKEMARGTDFSPRMMMYHINTLIKKVGVSTKEDLISFFRNAQGNSIDEILKEQQIDTKKKKSRKLILAVSFLLIIVCAAVYIYVLNKYSESNVSVNNVVNFQNNYLNRYAIAEQVTRILNRQDDIKTVVIVGAGGAGKTTLGREVLSSTESKIKFEINAETEESLYNSYLDLAEYIAISETDKNNLNVIKNLTDAVSKKKSLIRFVSTVLKKSGEWTLLFDNVVSLVQIKPYLPLNPSVFGKGIVIITTRNENTKETK